ncbi:Na/Pi symporter [Natranaerobius trueperi]|nr:Na/Pi symporter [Natranaerobius trueperi]
MQILIAIFGLLFFLVGVKILSAMTPHFIALNRTNYVSFKNIVLLSFIGFVLTALTQSSSAVGVIILIFLDKELLSFKQAASFLVGSNVGTTVSGQIFALSVEKLIIPSFLFGTIMLVLSTKLRKLKYIGKALISFSLIFIGLEIMGSVSLYYRENLVRLVETFDSLFQAFLIGAILTAFCQSSSLIIGILILLTGKQIILPEYATAAVMGLNIGTSTTLLVASLGLSNNGKLGAVFQLVYNSLCALILFVGFPIFLDVIGYVSVSPERFVANAHTMFNIFACIALLLFWKYIEKLVRWIVFN